MKVEVTMQPFPFMRSDKQEITSQFLGGAGKLLEVGEFGAFS